MIPGFLKNLVVKQKKTTRGKTPSLKPKTPGVTKKPGTAKKPGTVRKQKTVALPKKIAKLDVKDLLKNIPGTKNVKNGLLYMYKSN